MSQHAPVLEKVGYRRGDGGPLKLRRQRQRKPQLPRKLNQVSRHLGPHSRLHNFDRVDRRTRAGRLLDRVRKELEAHVGPNPSAVQQLLIQRACVLSLRLALIDQKIFEEEAFTTVDSNMTVAWQNALTKCLRALGVPVEAPKDDAEASINRIMAELDHVG
jgi:hypothetical protein